MSFREKNAWIFGGSVLLAFALYVLVILGRAGDGPLVEVAYVVPMLWAIGGVVLVNVLASVIVSLPQPQQIERTDERERLIARHADAVGLWVLSVLVLGALCLAMAECPQFWIAQAIYFAFVVSSLASTAATLLAFRRGFAPW